MVTASFSMMGPGFEQRVKDTLIGREISYVRTEAPNTTGMASRDALNEMLARNDFIEEAGNWYSRDTLVGVYACLDETFVQAVNVSLNFDTPTDPRNWIARLEQMLGELGFRFVPCEKISSAADAVQISLASEYWDSRNARAR